MTKIIKRLVSSALVLTVLLSLITVADVMAEDIKGWNVIYNGGAVGSVENDTNVFYNGSGSLKIVNKTPRSSNIYILVQTEVRFQAGRAYYIESKVKSNRSQTVQLAIDWDKRYSLTPFGGTFDWTNYEFVYIAPAAKTSTFRILVEGTSNGLWVDDIKIIDSETGENLIENSTFDNGNVSQEVINEESPTENLESLYNEIRASESFDEEDIVKVRGAFKYMPVYIADDILIDGDGTDWENYPSMSMPTLSTQYQIYMNDGFPRDVQAESKFAYDDENFYLYIEVIDDKFVYMPGEDGYWKGDSIQLAFSGLDEVYGSEMGLAHNSNTNVGEIYGTGFSIEERKKISLVTSQEGNKTIYEAKIPWEVKFLEKPESLLFNFLVNDNDGNGRRYCAELSPGISEGKSNALFPLLEMLDGQKDWYGWVQGNRTGYTEENNKFEYYLINSGEEKTFTIENKVDNIVEEVVVPANSGIRREINHVFDTKGAYSIQVNFKTGDDEFLSSAHIDVDRKPPDKAYSQNVKKKLEQQAKELSELIDKCTRAGISTDYEKIAYRIIERFAEYIEDDIEQGDFGRILYTEDTTGELYNTAKADLEAYLKGEKESKAVPKYITSEMKLDGKTALAETQINGSYETRPVFFVGYGHFTQSRSDIPVFNELGVNTIQNEIGPSYVISGGWDTQISGTPDAINEISGEDVRKGENALKLSFRSAQIANQFISLTQTVSVTPGKTYELKGYVKAENATNIWISANNHGDRNRLDGDYDWKEFSYEYTAPAGTTNTIVRILNEGPTNAVYFDDITFCEKGSMSNLLIDGDFENFGEWQFNENAPRLIEYLDMLQTAEENDIAVSVLLSPHYFPQKIIDEYGIGMTGAGFFNYNVNAPEAREIIEMYLRNLIPILKEYKSVNNICISNEPQFQASGCGDYYLEDWHEYLKGIYGEISELNKVYKTEYNNFEEIDLSADFSNISKFYDYKVFNDKLFSDWHRWMADIIHEIAPEIPLHMKVMGYTKDEGGSVTFSTNGTGYQEYCDFLDLNGCDYWNYEDNSTLPLVKEMWYDYMCSLRDAPVINSEDHIIPDRNQNFSDEIGDYVAQDIYQGAIHGRYMSDIWVWERSYVHTSDFWGSILFRPDAIAKISKATLDLNRNAYEITALQNEIPEIGILYSEPSVLYNPNMMHAAYQSYAAAMFNGKRVKFIAEKQLWNMNDCKMVIVPEATNVLEQTLKYLKEYIQNGGYVLILGSDSLKKNEHDLDNNKELIDFIYENSNVIEYNGSLTKMLSPTSEEFYSIVRDALKNLGIYYASVIDADTNEPVVDVEYNLGVYNGDLVINLVNFGDDKNVKIQIGNEAVESAEDIISNGTVGEIIELKKYVPVTLRIAKDNPFLDTYGHWAENDIKYLSELGVISGISESRFAPQRNITRAEFLAILMRIDGYEGREYKGNIPDIKSEDWFAQTVTAALEEGIIDEDIPFRPNDNITREEMCELLIKCYEHKNGVLSGVEKSEFTDAAKIGNIEAVSKAAKLDLVYGYDDGSFAPEDFASRAEATAIMARYSR